MTNTICGHDRNALRMALEDLAHIDNNTIVELARIPEALPDWRNAVLDLIDPAKLVAMLAERGRELGWTIGDGTLSAANVHIFVVHDVAMVHVLRNAYDLRTHRQFTLLQARALLLKWLNLPDGAREEAERVLWSANGV